MRFAVTAKDCVFKVANNALFSINGGLGTMEFGPGSSEPTSVTSVSNRVEITDGAVLKIRELRLSGESNSLAINDGKVVYEGSASEEQKNYYIGYTGPKANNNGIISSNCVVSLRGKNAKIDAPNVVMYIYPSCKLQLEIPEEGYEKGYTPINLKNIYAVGNADLGSIEIECAKFVEKTGGALTIAKLSQGASSSLEQMLQATAQRLPKGCKLTWDNKAIVLKSKRMIGSVMIVR